MEIQKQIDDLKPLLAEAQDAYCHALAAGDLHVIPQRKQVVNKYKKQLGKLIKERMAP